MSKVRSQATLGLLELSSDPLWVSWGPFGTSGGVVVPLGHAHACFADMPSWGHLGDILVRLGSSLWPSRGALGAMLEPLRALLEPFRGSFGASVGPNWGNLCLLARLGPSLKPSWGVLGATLGPLKALLAPSLGPY